MDKKTLHMVAFLLMFAGALNWGLVGLLNLNLVELLLGYGSVLSRVVYILVGVSGVYVMITHREDCKICSKK